MSDSNQGFSYATAIIKILLVLLGMGIFLHSRHAFIFFSAAILPGISTIFIDQANHKCASATICTFNLIGIMPYLKKLYFAHSINEVAKDTIIDPFAWLSIYSITFVGFLIYFTIPEIIAYFYVAKVNMKITNLHERRDRVCKDWDIDLQ